jgi:hypothetical protein
MMGKMVMVTRNLTVTILLGALLNLPVTALAQADFTLIPRDDQFPDGISPTHVYAHIDLLDRSLDPLLERSKLVIKNTDYPQTVEASLLPMHVYQCVLICTWRLQTLNDRSDFHVKHIPTISANPRKYDPRDVYFIVDMMLNNVRQIGDKLGVDLPTDEQMFADKTPTDVYNRGVQVFIKLHALCGYNELSPNEVYAQMVRGVDDVKSMLRQNDPACRYRIDAPPTEPNRTPGDVFAKCLEVRNQINVLRRSLDMKPNPVPSLPNRETIGPRDVFFQTQIIIAELNLLKEPLATKSSSPLTIPVTGKTPTHVYEQASMILHLLKQVQLSE